ncbi:hypothetical protein BDV34DRAFT_40313 [Aspergillus parasiticus]|uniref:Uncharacterized protein n=1 Tax=Aspergillus parasiticus TaxID=5067 RepID=A0A5N6D3E3_ASPPA|nr:hypothetical protein BDV34DRAFT_40313 [Aspergillus parasiticus]
MQDTIRNLHDGCMIGDLVPYRFRRYQYLYQTHRIPGVMTGIDQLKPTLRPLIFIIFLLFLFSLFVSPLLHEIRRQIRMRSHNPSLPRSNHRHEVSPQVQAR